MDRAKRYQSCSICQTLPDVAVELWMGDKLLSGVLPEAASRLKIVGAPIFDDLDSCLKQCPECGTFYKWTYNYDFLKGSEDEFILTRLSEAEGQQRVQAVFKYLRENTEPVEEEASSEDHVPDQEPSPTRYPAMAALVDKEPLSPEAFAEVLAQHRAFIESGGGGAWETFRHHIKRFEHPSLKLEGKGKHSRHVKFRALDDIDTEAVRWLLAEALKRVSNG